jgi:uncharacterized membrane protein
MNIKILILIWLLVGLATSLIVTATSQSPKYEKGDWKYILAGTFGGILTTGLVAIILFDIHIISPNRELKRKNKGSIK